MIPFIKKVLREIRFRCLHGYGSVRSSSRMIPQFLIIGAQKGGTSSLFYYLKSHPQIKRAIKKEIHYFNIFFDKGQKWYLAHFPSKSSSYMTGEASPDYIFHPNTPERVKSLNPKMKIIVLLRNPIERAYSAYQMNKRLNIDPRSSFEDAVYFELNHKDIDSTQYTYDRHNFFYLKRGKYAEQLSHWSKYFPKDQLLIINSHQLFNETIDTVSQVQHFLNIELRKPSSVKPMNVGHYPPITKELTTSLAEYFKEDLQHLKDSWQIDFTAV